MIPIYRAKKIDSNEYVIGYLLPEYKGKFYLSVEWSSDFDGDTPDFVQIDISTLSIHFPDMLDSQGNKIFASLNGDGKGGDIVEYNEKQEIIKYSNGTIETYMFRFEDLKELSFEAVGIQE